MDFLEKGEIQVVLDEGVKFFGVFAKGVKFFVNFAKGMNVFYGFFAKWVEFW